MWGGGRRGGLKYKHRRWEHVPLENVNNANFWLKLPPFTPFPAPTSATPAPPCPDNVTLGGVRLREMSADGGQLQYFMFYLQSLPFFIFKLSKHISRMRSRTKDQVTDQVVIFFNAPCGPRGH